MESLDTREWLLTNGLGSFACGTVCDARTRTYHGWLIAALDPPSQRTLLLSHLEATLEVGGLKGALGTNFWSDGTVAPLGYQLLRSFEIEPVPTWVWSQDDWQLTRQLVMPYGFAPTGDWKLLSRGAIEQGRNFLQPTTHLSNRILIQYRYEGREVATLRLRPLIGDRNFHHQQSAEPELQFSQIVGQRQVCLQAIRPAWIGTPWQLRWSKGEYRVEGLWYWNYYYPEENRRGLSDREDLWCPGYITVTLQPGEVVILEAKVGWPDPEATPVSISDFEQALQASEQRSRGASCAGEQGSGGAEERRSGGAEERRRQGEFPYPSPSSLSLFPRLRRERSAERHQSPGFDVSAQPNVTSHQSPVPDRIWRQLLRAGDRFIVYRASISGPTIIAGYPWFNDWGRDTLIALPGLALATGRLEVAKGLLQTFGQYSKWGLIPNAFPDVGAEPFYNSIDASLWWIETLGLYLEATQDWDFLAQQYPVVRQIYKAFSAGTLYNIHVDATDGLLTWDAAGVALTWMDVVINGQPVTPRRGKPVEINALWYSALCWATKWAEKLLKGTPANPVSLQNQRDRYAQQAKQVKKSLQKFWNPKAQYFYDTISPDDQPDPRIRPNAVLALSLYHCGFPEEQARQVLQVARDRLLTPYGLRSLDPSDPDYIGRYMGDPIERDSAYHQGTVWSWLIGPFIRAWKRFYDSQPVPFDWEPMLEHFQQQACLGSISEIFDGDRPHSPQGAFAQAWSVAELIRYWHQPY